MENLKPKQLSTTRVCTLIRTKIVVWFWGQITFDSNKNILPSEDIMTEEQRQFSEHFPLFRRDALLGGLKALERLMEGEVQFGPRRINIEKALVLSGPRFATRLFRREERVTLLMAEIRERDLNRREARESIEGYDGAKVEKLRFVHSGAKIMAHGEGQIRIGLRHKVVQNNVIAATSTPLRTLTSLKQSFFRHEHAFKVTNPGRANLGLMSLVSVFSKEGSPDNTIAVGSDNILSLTLPFGQVHDRCDEDNCVFPEQNISLDKLDLEAMTHLLESRPPMLRELDLLGTFDLHQSPITTVRNVRPNKEAEAVGDNAEDALPNLAICP
ncbi:hypothetical protein D6D19_07043 [Aureobasidium pullulans]|uniref:Uncharacterized protein n=1 Tax=Aureobasidium pullulans TaxID=5580 RepID=A0A4S8ZZ65_AURPU|nr:hypothetical protein D6D19_07043 [Aureobasidium pullulans]